MEFLMSGVTATARGRFVCAEHKSWPGFNGKDGPVSAGQSLNIYVLTGTDEAPALVKIWVGSEDIDRGLAAARGVKFGELVEFIVQPGARNSYRFIDRSVLQKAG